MSDDSRLTGAIEMIRLSAKGMESDSNFKCIFEEWPAATDDDIVEWEEWADSHPGMAGYQIPTALRALYRATGGFRWRWQFLPDLPTITTGSAELVDLLSLFQRDDEENQPLAGIFRAPRQFDVLSKTECVSVRFSVDPALPPKLVHFNEDDALEEGLSVFVEEYLLALARYRALYGWQSLFHKNAKARDETSRRLDATIERLFT